MSSNRFFKDTRKFRIFKVVNVRSIIMKKSLKNKNKIMFLIKYAVKLLNKEIQTLNEQVRLIN